MNTKHILISGNPVDGFTFTGPFDSVEAAVESGAASSESWHVGELQAPDGIDRSEDALRDALREVTPLARQFVDDWAIDVSWDDDADDAKAQSDAERDVTAAEKLIEA